MRNEIKIIRETYEEYTKQLITEFTNDAQLSEISTLIEDIRFKAYSYGWRDGREYLTKQAIASIATKEDLK